MYVAIMSPYLRDWGVTVCLKKNKVLQNRIDAHVCHDSVASHTVDEAATYSASHENKGTTPYIFEVHENAVDPR